MDGQVDCIGRVDVAGIGAFNVWENDLVQSFRVNLRVESPVADVMGNKVDTAIAHLLANYKEEEPRAWVFDIGANSGLFTCMAASLCRRFHVLAVEPQRSCIERIEATLHDDVDDNCPVVMHAAVGRSIGSMRVQRDTRCDQLFSAKSAKRSGGGGGGSTDRIAKVPLLKLIEDHVATSIYLLKVDVEGAELDVFHSLLYTDHSDHESEDGVPHYAGASPIWPKHIIFESQHMRANKFRELVEQLVVEHGYACTPLASIVPADFGNINDASPHSYRYIDSTSIRNIRSPLPGDTFCSRL
jgi:FkbM family methyltransferase